MMDGVMPRTGLNFDFLCVGGKRGLKCGDLRILYWIVLDCTSFVVEDLFDWRDLG